MLRTITAGCLLAISFSGSAFAEDLNWAQKMFDKLNVDFGVVARGSEARQQVVITNRYKQTVHIANVSTTCGCSAATPSQTELATFETATIDVEMNTQRFIRRKDSTLVITFDKPLHQEVRVPITAYIRTDVVLMPGGADFGAIDFGQESQRKLSIAYAGRDDWNIQEVRSGSEHIDAQVVETSRGGGRVNYDLLITMKPTAPVGTFRQQMLLVTDDSRAPHVPVLVEARVESDITVTPPIVSLGMLTPGRTKTVNVVLRGKQPFSIERIECESDMRAFQVRIANSEKQVHVLPLTVNPPDAPGKFSEEFLVKIAGRPDPLTFRAYGRIVK